MGQLRKFEFSYSAWVKLRIFLASVTLTLAIFPQSSFAYEESGHYYTVALVVNKLIPEAPPLETSFVAFCAQLPDETNELDAVEVYKGIAYHPVAYPLWALFGANFDNSVGRMVAVQQLLHGLTGGKADTVQVVAKEIVKTIAEKVNWQHRETGAGDPALLCALGLALHLYGDSFAHRQLDNPQLMYPTGKGHAVDLTFPDYPLYRRDRAEEWKNYVVNTAPQLGNFSLDADVMNSDLAQVLRLPPPGKTLDISNEYGEAAIREILTTRINGRLPKLSMPLEQHGHEPCQRYIKEVFNNGNFSGFSVPQCAIVWRRFREISLPVFERYPDSRSITLELADPEFEQ